MKNFLKVVFGSCLGVILASIVVFIIFFAMLGSAIGNAMEGFTGGKETKKVSSESVLLLDIKGGIKDTEVINPFDSFSSDEKKNYTLPQILQALEVARENSNIEAVVINLEGAGINFATARELRDALKRFQEGGKKVYAFSDYYGFLDYYVSSVADEVIGGPEGSIAITGLSSSTIFKKGLLKKLGIEMQVFKVGTFKGAVEPYILEKLSPENRLQIQEFLNGLWQGTTAEMAESRHIDAGVFQRFADEAYFLDKTSVAEELGLLDTLVYRIDLDKVLAKKIYGDAKKEMDYVRVENLLPLYNNGKGNEEVAVIYAEGNIVVGTGEDQPTIISQQAMINEQLVKKLREAGEDDDIKAVVLRVNSGGGAVTTSELICHELQQLKKIKPVVISMGDYAASGGYYISSHASKIVANPYTLTGSIGIFGMIPNAKGTMDKLGLTEDTVATSETGTLSISKPITGKLAEGLQRAIERGYDEFTKTVASGRGMTQTKVDSIGQGRVWLGNKAMELGLVDMMGGLNTAIQEAARLAELSDYRIIELVDKTNWFEELFGIKIPGMAKSLSMTNEERMLSITEAYLKELSGVKAMPPFDITSIGESANETRSFFTIK